MSGFAAINWGDKWNSLKSQASTLATYVKTSVEKQLDASESLASLDADELGVAYVTDRVLIIPFPSDTPTHVGKAIDNLAHFLKTNYKSRFMIWNLAEKSYDYSAFDEQVIEVRFPGYPAPPLDQLFMICQSIHGFLSADPKNVAVVHCQSGTGRSVCTAAAYVAWAGIVKSPAKALELVAKAKRAKSLASLVIPTQARYYTYISALLNGKYPHTKLVYLERVILNGIPRFEDVKGDGQPASQGCRPYLQIFKNAKLIHTTTGRDKVLRSYVAADNSVLFPVGLVLDGDILVRVRHLDRANNRVSMLRFGFHTGYIAAGNTRFTRAELDGAARDKRFDSDFFIDLIFRSVEDKSGADVKSDRDTAYWEKIAQRKAAPDPKGVASPGAANGGKAAAGAKAGGAGGAGGNATDAKAAAVAAAGAAAAGSAPFKFSLFGDDDEGLEDDAAEHHAAAAAAAAAGGAAAGAGAGAEAKRPAVASPGASAKAAAKPAAAKPAAAATTAGKPATAVSPAPAKAATATTPATAAAKPAAATPASTAAATKPAAVAAPAVAADDDFDDLEDYVKTLGVTAPAAAAAAPAAVTAAAAAAKPAATASATPAAAAATATPATATPAPAAASAIDDIDADTEALLAELNRSAAAEIAAAATTSSAPAAAGTPAKPAAVAAAPTTPAATTAATAADLTSPGTALTADDDDLLAVLNSAS